MIKKAALVIASDDSDLDAVRYDGNGLMILPEDRFFNPWWIALGTNLNHVIKETQGMIAKYEDHFKLRQRSRKLADQIIFNDTIEAVICDMMIAHLKDDTRGSAISLSNQVLGRRSRYRPSAFSKTLPHILKCMASPEMGFIRMQKGEEKHFNNRGQRTLIWPGWRTIDRMESHNVVLADIGKRASEEIIILKAMKLGFWDDGVYLEYPDTEQTLKMREELADVNLWLSQADISIDHGGLLVQRPMQIQDRRLRRIFTRGSFESGGRLFGGFWQSMRKDERMQAVEINGEPVVGLDYGQIAPRIAYGLAAAKPAQDDLYQIGNNNPCYREGMKKLINALLSCEQPLTRKPKGLKELLPPNPIDVLIQEIGEAHKPIAPYFCNGTCHHIQFIESSIMMGVLLRLRTEGIVALPIHDGVLVAESAMDVTQKVMEDVAEEVAGINIPVDQE